MILSLLRIYVIKNYWLEFSSLFSIYLSIALETFSNAICNEANNWSFPTNGMILGNIFFSKISKFTYLAKHPNAIMIVALKDDRDSSGPPF